MSDLSKYLPKKYQKKSSKDQIVSPIKPFENQSGIGNSVPRPQQTPPQSNNNGIGISPKKNKSEKSPKQKKTILLGVLLLVLLFGTLTSLFLIKRSQDIRQQAEQDPFFRGGPGVPYPTYTPTPTSPPRTPTTPPRTPTTPPRRPTSTPTARPTVPAGCIEECPGSDGILRNCTPPEPDGTPEESICNRAGRIASCGGREYCCPVAGGSWTTTMTACLEPTNPPLTPTVTPSIEPTETQRFSCSSSGCATDSECEDGLICIQGAPDNGGAITVGICGLASLADECRNNRNYDSCCVGPTTTTTPSPTAISTDTPTESPTDTPTTEPTTEPTPVLTRVITTVGCNESCNENADCTNVSHICYEGMCRLDVNPTDVNCRLADGGTVIERAAVIPTESGFADWFNYLKAGLGILGLGALLLLLL